MKPTRGDVVKVLRDARLTQRDIAGKMGIHESTLCHALRDPKLRPGTHERVLTTIKQEARRRGVRAAW